MKSYLLVAVLICGGCLGQASEEQKQQIDQGVQIGKEIYTQGTNPNSQLAKDNLVVLTSIQTVVGEPKEAIPYTTENVEALNEALAEEARNNTWIKGVLRGVGAVVGDVPGLGWIFTGGSFITGLFELLRRKRKTIAKITKLARGAVTTVHEIKEAAKAGKISGKDIKKIMIGTQKFLEIREDMVVLVKDVEASIKLGGKP